MGSILAGVGGVSLVSSCVSLPLVWAVLFGVSGRADGEEQGENTLLVP